MSPNESRALCVSIHDVAPSTWTACERLWKALSEVAPGVPLTWLVVPRYHDRDDTSTAMEEGLAQLQGEGHELALHGYTHLDHGPPPADLRQRFLRRIYTTGEGEFAALDEAAALQRIDLGLAWFERRGWPVRGFVAPAWLMSSGARAAVRQRPFSYMTTFTKFEILPDGPGLNAPSLVYIARQRAGRWLSPRIADAAAAAMAGHRLIRFSLHPADAAHPALIRHAQAMLERLLRERAPMTKAQFAGSCRHAVAEKSDPMRA
jgi:predicted deacetylase